MAAIPALQALAAAHVAAGPRLDHQPGCPTVPGRPPRRRRRSHVSCPL